MINKNFFQIIISFAILFLTVSFLNAAEETEKKVTEENSIPLEGPVTTDEIYQKLNEAVDFIKKGIESGEEWEKEFSKADGKFSWKGVFVLPIDSERTTYVSHPYSMILVGMNLSILKDKKTKKSYFKEICAVKEPHGKWLEYFISKPGSETPQIVRKIICVFPIAETKYLVSAEVYDETTSIKDLNARLVEMNQKTEEVTNTEEVSNTEETSSTPEDKEMKSE